MRRFAVATAVLALAGAARAERLTTPLPCKAADVFVAAAAERILVACEDRTLQVIETPSGRVLRALTVADTSAVSSAEGMNLAFSPRGDRIAVGFRDGRVGVWEVDRPSPPIGWKGAFYPGTLLFTQDGRGLFANEVLLDVGATLQPRARLAVDFDTISDVATSPDGKLAVVPAGDTRVRLYETATWRPVAEYAGLAVESFVALFVDQGRRVLIGAADGRVLVLDGRTLELRSEVPGPPGYFVTALRAAGPGRVIVRYRPDDGRGERKAARLDLQTLAVTPQPGVADVDVTAERGGRLWLYRIDGRTLRAEPLP